jgi:hypothetical protein
MSSGKLEFNEKKHEYKIGKTKLTSVTTFVGSFFEPFNAKEIARKLAKFPANKKNKRGVRYWLNKWKESAEYGTEVHKAIEDFINGDYVILGDIPKAQRGVEFLETIKGELKPELKVYDEELLLAGTIDVLEILEDGSINLYDWKTNEKLDNKSFNGKKGIKHPMLDIEDTKLNKYGLQLSTYAYILERQGFKIKGLFIVHLKDSGYKLIEVGYDKGLVKKMLKEVI